MKAINLFPSSTRKLRLARSLSGLLLPVVSLSILPLLLAGCCAKPLTSPSSSSSSSAGAAATATAAASTSSNTDHAVTPAKPAPAPPATSEKSSASGWQSLFDGKSLDGWKITEFGGHGEVAVENGQLTIHTGAMLSGVSRANDDIPKTDYEIELEARKVDGGDFFCGMTFPVGDSFCSFIIGGWGGGVVGLSSIDGLDASENETTKYMSFPKDHWFSIRLRVTQAKIQAWIDSEQMVDQSIVGRKISLRAGEIYLSEPFGIATWQTTGALRNIRLRRLAAAAPGAVR